MPWEKCVTVSLNSDSTGCFYTGDIVTGTITLDLHKNKKIETIDLEIIGISKAQWSRAMPTIPYIKVYSEKKKVLCVKYADIFGIYRRSNIIMAGLYSYPFHFALPVDLPSSFKSSVGKVYYHIKITSKPKCKVRKVVPFTVLSRVNINNLDEMLTPRTYEFCIFKRFAGNVTVHVKTYQEIASRQIVPFEIKVNNEKNVRISAIHVTLVQKLQYTVSSGYAVEEKTISRVTHSDVGKAISEVYILHMEIPQIIPSSVHATEPMIDISYVFRLEVCFPFHFNLHKDIPVTVATVSVIHNKF